MAWWVRRVCADARSCFASPRVRPSRGRGGNPSTPSLRAQRSNPDCLRGRILDCFAALAMTENEERSEGNEPHHVAAVIDRINYGA
ncbi:hypothetical protein XH89_08270 [Bradyrhizobium sp. CCBAU 53340]|nr:hypothetical protein XH89_08270 [Bradyrhizobium sp. CCBAU 53340]